MQILGLDPIHSLTIEMPGKPTPWARTGGRGNIRFTKPAQREGKKGLIQVFQSVAGKDFMPHDGPVELSMTCYFQMPNKARWWKKAALAKIIPCCKTPDFDNLSKLVGDGLNQIAWKDDSQIFCGHVEKWWGERSRTIITMTFYPKISTKADYADIGQGRVVGVK